MDATEFLLKNTVPSITTSGFASAEVAPDIAIISLGVETERRTAPEAMSENARAAQAVVDEIKADGIGPRDIRTLSVTLDPVYDETQDARGATKRTLRGYSARNDISVRLRQIEKAGALAQKWIEKGAHNLGGIAFDFEQKEVKYDALRSEAARDALRKANSYVSALGLRLGRILVIAPHSAFSGRAPAPMGMARAALRDGAAAIPVESGVQILQAEVDVTWELAQ
jgi:hypothetical protein